MTEYMTSFGSLSEFEKGRLESINDDPRHYAFSNMFEVASKSAPYEKVVVAKNLQYVIEILRAEGASDWYGAAHDEFALCMDGEIEVRLVKPGRPLVPEEKEGSVKLGARPDGAAMGTILLRRGHQALLPANAAYQFQARRTGVILMQTILGDHSVVKWADICVH